MTFITEQDTQKPDYLIYTEDIFYYAIWKWKWSRWPKSKGYYPDKLQIICSECGIELRYFKMFTYYCTNPDCKKFEDVINMSYLDKEENIKKNIWARINSGKYKERIEEMKKNYKE